MAACNLGNCTIHEILKCVSEILLVGNDDNTRDDDGGSGDSDDKDDDSRLTGGMKLW